LVLHPLCTKAQAVESLRIVQLHIATEAAEPIRRMRVQVGATASRERMHVRTQQRP
jgi:hypothetical protein